MLVAATACWGTGTVVTKQVLDDIDPLALLPMQLAASCLFLLAACGLARTKITWTPDTRRLTALGILNPGIAYALGLLGLATITASMSVLLWAAEPVLIVVLAAALLREHISAALAAGLGVSVVGVVLVVYQPGAAGAARGIALTLAAVAACALYSVLTRRLLVDDASLPVVLLQQAAALGFALALAVGAGLAGWQEWWPAEISPGVAVASAASGILYYGAAFWFYLAGLRQVPASVAGSFLPLIPVFGVAAGLVAGERLGSAQWVGAALVVAGTVLVARRAR
ncbi:DMT family transporter [Nocardioides sp. YIM 152315]|uniref:DMT family transporter n=1 Tax=Nocardioides sp. YIM 152315 TaxID=3031760 RepID=UPI0023DA3DBD|nr:DMT family transporter [Nocardioides sp. YIM 152315]MDF1603512.1 DMT family transporter [Nocardioides sp. YIM 152315]